MSEKAKRLRGCPEALGEMIDLWNSLEHARIEESMPVFLHSALYMVEKDRFGELIKLPYTAIDLSARVDEWLQHLPSNILAWINSHCGVMPGTDDIPRYGYYIQMPLGEYEKDLDFEVFKSKGPTFQEVMDWCVSVLNWIILLRRSHQIAKDLVERGESQPTTFWSISSSFKPDSKGRLEYIPSVPEEWLRSMFSGIEAARIKRCVVCNQFFWAGRLDQTACSQKCASLHRVRTYRRKHPPKKGDDQNEED